MSYKAISFAVIRYLRFIISGSDTLWVKKSGTSWKNQIFLLNKPTYLSYVMVWFRDFEKNKVLFVIFTKISYFDKFFYRQEKKTTYIGRTIINLFSYLIQNGLVSHYCPSPMDCVKFHEKLTFATVNVHKYLVPYFHSFSCYCLSEK